MRVEEVDIYNRNIYLKWKNHKTKVYFHPLSLVIIKAQKFQTFKSFQE